jgi:hypothetical protein
VVKDPAAVIQSIHQVTRDTQGDTVILMVESYFTSVQRMTYFLPKDAGDWPIDVTQHFQSYLREDIRREMKSNSYIYNAALALKDPYSQLMILQDCYDQASIAETSINWVRKSAQEEVSNHSLVAQINKSVAEGTIKRYTVNCWGCDQTGHSFANKQGQITCPNKDKPGVQDRAAKARKDFNGRQ